MWSLACLCSCPSVWEALCLPASWLGLWPDTEGLRWAGSITLQMTSVLQEVILCGSDSVALPLPLDYTCWSPCAKAEKQSRAGQEVAVHRRLCRPLGETRKQQRFVKSHAVATTHVTEKDYTSCTSQDTIFWASSCKTDAKCYHLLMTAQDAKKWKNACMGKQSPSNPKGDTQL